MPMAKRALKTGLKVKRKSAAERTAQAKETRKNRAAKKKANKAYYTRNQREILKRAKARNARRAKGDTRTTRRATMK